MSSYMEFVIRVEISTQTFLNSIQLLLRKRYKAYYNYIYINLLELIIYLYHINYIVL